jgi:hypothetical protein
MSEMSQTGTRVSRRDVMRFALIGGVVGSLAGCTSSAEPKPTPTTPGSPQDPDHDLRAEVGRDQAAMTALYLSAKVPSSMATKVSDLGERHKAYGRAIDPKHATDGSSSADPAPVNDGASLDGGSQAPSGSATPETPSLGIKGLRKAEIASSTTLLSQAKRAVDPELTRILVLAAAGSASAAEALKVMTS